MSFSLLDTKFLLPHNPTTHSICTWLW